MHVDLFYFMHIYIYIYTHTHTCMMEGACVVSLCMDLVGALCGGHLQMRDQQGVARTFARNLGVGITPISLSSLLLCLFRMK